MSVVWVATHWDTKGYEGLSNTEKQFLLYTPCDNCISASEFRELADWCFEYSKLTLTYLHSYCVEQYYDRFAEIIEEEYPYDSTGLATLRGVARSGRPLLRQAH